VSRVPSLTEANCDFINRLIIRFKPLAMIQANKTKTRVNLSGRDQKKESYLQSNISLAVMLDVVDKKGHRLETTNVLRITSYMDHLKIKVKVTDPSQFWETGQGHIYRKV
jgi:hypothetical protein